MSRVYGNIYAPGAEGGGIAVLGGYDEREFERFWEYYPPVDGELDFLIARWPNRVIGELLQSRVTTFTIPTSEAPYVPIFPTAGLDRYIKSPGDVCR
ncbi:MAG: hypothetical protein J4F43_09860 [Dehalococcoidia bacterium]|nr:hypothetical protein [Dehalococcoidia bacterium]